MYTTWMSVSCTVINIYIYAVSASPIGFSPDITELIPLVLLDWPA